VSVLSSLDPLPSPPLVAFNLARANVAGAVYLILKTKVRENDELDLGLLF
jgi:hypothetical protein